MNCPRCQAIVERVKSTPYGLVCDRCAEAQETSPPEPTVIEMLNVAQTHRLDRLSMVQEPRADREAGIMVVLIGDHAIRQIGPGLVDFARQTGQNTPNDWLEVPYRKSLRWVFDWLQAEEQQWSYGRFQHAGDNVMMAAFLGTRLCERLARFLTHRGCPTSLT